MFPSKYIKYLLVLVLLAAASFASTGCGKNEAPAQKKKVNDSVAVSVAPVTKQTLSIAKTFSGSLEGEAQADVSSKSPERIITLNVKVGSNVSKGQTIMTLDKSGASSQFYQAQAALKNAERDYNRMKALLAEGAISQQLADQAETQYEVAKANFQAAQDAVVITAPISGVVTALNVSVGDIAAPGMKLLTIANIGRMKAVFNAGESDLAALRTGQNVEVYSEVRPDEKITGKISEITSSAEVASRTFQVKVSFPNTSDRFYKPGMFVRVDASLTANKKDGTIVVPTEAVLSEGDASKVFVVVNGKAQARDIRTGLTNGKVTEVISGLNENEQVITAGMNNVSDGKSVTIVK